MTSGTTRHHPRRTRRLGGSRPSDECLRTSTARERPRAARRPAEDPSPCTVVPDDVGRRTSLGLAPRFRRSVLTAVYTIHPVQVRFRKLVEKRLTTWDAVRGKRTRVAGSTMALGRGEMPHDLIQMIVESVAELDRGFWGSVAAGATFNSMSVKRTTPGEPSSPATVTSWTRPRRSSANTTAVGSRDCRRRRRPRLTTSAGGGTPSPTAANW